MPCKMALWFLTYQTTNVPQKPQHVKKADNLYIMEFDFRYIGND